MLLCLFALPTHARADMLSLEGGQGFHHSGSTQALFLRYQWEAALLFGQEGFWETALGAWNGPNRVETIGFARGLRFRWQENNYVSAQAGLHYITRRTENLGTPLQLGTRLAVGRTMGAYDLSIGYVHFSNGKYLSGWEGPNYGENFATIQVGRKF